MQMTKVANTKLTRRSWVLEAKKTLINKGISEVKVEVLAKRLKVTPGSFYHHFSGRPDLYASLLDLWKETNTAPLKRAVESAVGNPKQQYLAFFSIWVLEKDFDPKFDQAVRTWGATSGDVGPIVVAEDKCRIALLESIFEGMGFQGLKAKMRARVTYYHQIGYYALGEEEPREQRLALVPEYAEILTDDDWLFELSSADAVRKAMEQLSGT
jgi:AcrR family transcriptional regulator